MNMSSTYNKIRIIPRLVCRIMNMFELSDLDVNWSYAMVELNMWNHACDLWGLQLRYSVPLIFLLLQVIIINFFLNSSKKKKQYCNVYWAKIDGKIATFPQRKSLFFLYNLRYINGYSIALVKEELNESHYIEKQQELKNKYSFN